jgi:hypothetical protein
MKIMTSLLLICTFLLTACSSEPKKMPYTLSIKAQGIGLVNRNTPFDASIIASKLLGFEVAQYTSFEAGVPHPLIRVTHNTQELFLIYPTDDMKYIHNISIQNPGITNADAAIGTNYTTVPKNKFDCTPPKNNQFTCKLHNSAVLKYLFVDDVLKEITWTPSR